MTLLWAASFWIVSGATVPAEAVLPRWLDQCRQDHPRAELRVQPGRAFLNGEAFSIWNVQCVIAPEAPPPVPEPIPQPEPRKENL
jgi:hypothetical protein